MKRLMHWLLLSCRKATALIEKRAVIKLSRKERLQLSLHMRMCDACNTYERQSVLLDEVLRHHLSYHAGSIPQLINPELKDRIAAKFE